MTIRGVSAAIAVRDRAAASRWYVDTLGFRIFDDDPEHWTTVGDRSGKFRFHLCEVSGAGKKPPRSEVGNTGLLLTTDEPFLRTCARLKKAGVRFSMPAKKLPWGWLAKFLGPDGNEFWLMPAD
ncbi:MAG: VOC family protein [Thermoplasmata archaeon]|nr:VOC family protein [Thermoplasmata archaeon]